MRALKVLPVEGQSRPPVPIERFVCRHFEVVFVDTGNKGDFIRLELGHDLIKNHERLI